MAGVRTTVRWWWARTWWVAVPLVSFGFLAFFPFLLAWWRTRRRAWLAWAVVSFLVPWGAAVVEDAAGWTNRTLGFIVLVTAIAAFFHALTVRRSGFVRPFRPWKDPQGLDVYGLATCVLLGLAGVVGAGVALVLGPHLDAAAVCLVAAAGFLALVPQFLSRPERLPVLIDDGERGRALLFTYRKWATRLAVAGGALLWSAVTVWFASRWSELDIFYKGTAITMVAVTPWFVGPLARLRVGPLLALTPQGIAGRFPSSVTYLPWSAVADVGLMEAGGGTAIAMAAADPTEVEKGFLDRLKETFETHPGPDAAYPVRGLEADHRALVATLRHYWENPGDRAELGTPASLQRFERIRRSVTEETPAAPSRP
ncbi:MAG TPA: hypothetical protein VG318_16395 [Actinomycetota bacterium]|nr:hypothetical protein [Actinomycetota bacterium]